MANPWKILTNLTASANALFKANVTLGDSSSDVIQVNGQLTASHDVLLDKSLTVNGTTTLGNAIEDVVTMNGQVTASNGMLVNGGLKVNGPFTYVNTTNLNVTDRKVTIADGATDVDGGGAAGIYVGDDINSLASVFASGPSPVWHLSGAGGTVVHTTSSADLTNIGTNIVSSNQLNIEKAFRAIDSVLATATTVSTIRNEYDKLRFVQTGSLATGNAVVSLAKNAFVNANKDFIVVDVMVRENNILSWTNDLVSVYMQTGSTYVDVTIDAPAISGGSWEYKLVAVNENTGSLGLIA